MLASYDLQLAKLLFFSFRVLHSGHNDKKIFPTKRIKNNCSRLTFENFETQHPVEDKYSKKLSKIIENKVSEGDLKGAARLPFSNDTLVPDPAENLSALQNKQPTSITFPPSPLNPPTSQTEFLQISCNDEKCGCNVI